MYVNYLPLTAQIIATIPVIKIKFVQHMENTDLSYSNFRFISVHVWNYLTSNIIINTTLADFKNKSKILIMSNYYYYYY